MRRHSRGAALVDLVFTCGLIAVVSAIAIPSLQASRERDAVRMAAQHLATRLQTIRVDALRRNRAVAVRFDPNDVGLLATFADGDGDGVLQTDIDRGVDPEIASAVRLSDQFESVSLRVAVDVPTPDGSGTIAAGSDPIRLGNTNLLTFTPLGNATSGTLYLAARAGPQMCVRVLGATGRVRVLWFDQANRSWRQD